MVIERKSTPRGALPGRSDLVAQLHDRRRTVPARVLGAPVSSPAAPTNGLLVILWRSRAALLLCVLLALAAGAAYIRTATPLYTSTAKLYLDYAGMRLSNPYDAGGRPQTDRYLCTQAEIIKSGPLLATAADTLRSRRLRTLLDVNDPLAYLQKNLVVDVGRKDEAISLSIRSPHAAEAAEIVNCVVDAYMDSRSQHERKNAAQVLKVLQEEWVRAGAELEKKRNELTDFQTSQMPLALGADQGGGVMQQYLESLQNAYTEAQIQTMDAETFCRAVRTLAPNPVALRQYVQLRGSTGAYVGADQGKAPLETKMIDLELQKEKYLETFTADYPKVAGLTSEIERIEGRLTALDDRFVQATLAAGDQRYAEAKSYEEQIARLYEQQKKQVVKLNAEVAQYQRLRTEVDELTRYFQAREQEVREIRKIVGEDVAQLRMAVLEEALPAPIPSTPQKARIMALALVLGLLLGGGIATARDRLDQTLRSADEIAAWLHVPVLGAVPAMSRRQRMSQRGRKVLLQPDSHEAEAFRTIRTAVFFGAPKDKTRTLLITSPAEGDGKSTLVSNLAIAIAHAGQKTLILDADFRRPAQHVIFGLDHHERCLSDVFAGTANLAAAVQPTGIEGLQVLTCGHGDSNPAEVLNSPQFAELLTCLKQEYERIVIDAPPVTVATDAQILGALCDATILVLKADRSVRKVAQHAMEVLRSVGACLLGVVVNNVARSGDRYGYYYGRYREYYSAKPSGAVGRSQRRVTAGLSSKPVRMIPKAT